MAKHPEKHNQDVCRFLRTGCFPKKLLMEAAAYANALRDVQSVGWASDSDPTPDAVLPSWAHVALHKVWQLHSLHAQTLWRQIVLLCMSMLACMGVINSTVHSHMTMSFNMTPIA